MPIKEDDVKMSLGIPRTVYETMLELVLRNKMENVRKKLKAENKKPDSMAQLIRLALEEKFSKKKKS